MLEYLRLENTGPAPELAMELGPRLNLIAGGNGLGKSFLLDVAWWALSGHWPSLLNPRLNRGYPARPRRGRAANARIGFGLAGDHPRRGEVDYAGRQWGRQRSGLRASDACVVLYAQADGAFALSYPGPHNSGVQSLALTVDEVWNGFRPTPATGETVTVYNGLLNDWSRWIVDGEQTH